MACRLSAVGQDVPQYGPNLPESPKTFNCIAVDPSGSGAKAAPPATPRYSYNGNAVAPRGELKVLVIFAGFTEDFDPTCGGYADPTWPQIDPTGTYAPFKSIPSNMGQLCYTSSSQFSLTATDQTISNFFHQMSRTAAQPFKVTFGYFPDRINIPAIRGNIPSNYNQDVLEYIKVNYPNFDWSPYDQHKNNPNFTANTVAGVDGPDGQIDYAVILYRTFYGGCSGVAAETGVASVGGITFPATSTRPAYSITTGHCQAGPDLHAYLFMHEFAHNLYNAPHLFGANGTCGNRYYQTWGWGMMTPVPTMWSANAWERWYLGWTSLQASGVSSDVQSAQSLTPNGEYTLRDYVTTGDVMRIRIPHTSQYLWLENHALRGPCDQRRGWGGGGDGQPLKPAPEGLLAMVEDMGSRTTLLSPFDKNKVNGLRVVSAAGNFDYYHSPGTSTYNNRLWGNELYNFVERSPNSLSGQNEISQIRLDFDNNGVIDYDDYHGNMDKISGNEWAYSMVFRGQFTDGLMGPNIGSRTVGYRMALDANPAIVPHAKFDRLSDALEPIKLNGLSVQITAVDAQGNITVRVRFNDTDLGIVDWSGNLVAEPVANTSSGYSYYLTPQPVRRSSLLKRSGTPNRSQAGPQQDFVNPTKLVLQPGVSFGVGNNMSFELRGEETTLYAEQGSHITLEPGAELVLGGGTTLSLYERNDLEEIGSGALIMQPGSRLIIRSTGQVFLGRQAAPVVQAYPNPAVGEVAFAWTANRSGERYSYQLQNLHGHIMQRGQVPANVNRHRLRGVAPGLYLLVVEGKDGRTVQRVEVK